MQELIDGQRKFRLKRAEELFRLHDSGQLWNVVFSDENPLHIGQFVKKQIDRVYWPKRLAENIHLRLAARTQVPPMIMVWPAVTADGRSPLIFIGRRIKVNAEYYRENVLKTALKIWADKHFSHRL